MGGTGWPDRVGGLIGCGEDPPKPVVLGGLIAPCGVTPVVANSLSLAGWVPSLIAWWIPANTATAISTTAAIPTIHPKGPLMLSPCGNPVSGRIAVPRISITRISHGILLRFQTRSVVSIEKPMRRVAGSAENLRNAEVQFLPGNCDFVRASCPP